MTSLDALKHIGKTLAPLYETDELASIAAILLEDAFGIKLRDIGDENRLTATQQAHLNDLLGRLLKHEPVQYVTGFTIFYGLKLSVNSNVLVPRQETEELVAWVVETAPPRPSQKGRETYRVLDVGTGSGCIPIAVKKKRPELEVHALDISPEALEVARENAAANGTEVLFHEVDILDEMAWKKLPSFDLIVSNPPYITEDEKDILPKNVVEFEPHLALFAGGNDTQRFVKKIAYFATQHLNPGGWLFFETSEFYAVETQEILRGKGFGNVELRKDLNKKDRMIRARLD
ncbi:MAG: peptide chain release factor N(5)-glutamine methyltransferase [Saprospiraceae bacterium]